MSEKRAAELADALSAVVMGETSPAKEARRRVEGISGEQMRKITQSSGAALIVPILFWLGGFDFSKRGFEAVMCALLTVYVFWAFYSFLRD